MIALAVLCLFPGQLPTLDSKDFTKEIQQKAVTATVRIANLAEAADGSGILLRQEEPFVYVLTANHVVGKANHLEVSVFTAASYPKAEKVYKGAEVLARDARADLAVLRLATKDALPAPLPLCPVDKAPDGKGTIVLTVGCQPNGVPLQMPDVVKAIRTVSKPGQDGKTKCWETAKGQVEGRSGGPMLDAQGRLIGVASGTSGGKGYYVHVEEIRAFLKHQALGWLAEEARCSDDKGADRPHAFPSTLPVEYVNLNGGLFSFPEQDAQFSTRR
jgi:S1-C subfamily serine protease